MNKKGATTTDLNNNNAVSEVFLNYKTQKKWADKLTGYPCYMMYAKSLYITWQNETYWTYNCFDETSDENIEVSKLSTVCWLDIRGDLRMSELSPGVVYEIVYEVKLTKGASGWELPIKLQLALPDGRVQERQVSLLEKPRKEWFSSMLETSSPRMENLEKFASQFLSMEDIGKPDL